MNHTSLNPDIFTCDTTRILTCKLGWNYAKLRVENFRPQIFTPQTGLKFFTTTKTGLTIFTPKHAWKVSHLKQAWKYSYVKIWFIYWYHHWQLTYAVQPLLFHTYFTPEINLAQTDFNMASIFIESRWIGCLTSQLTIFQSYMWRHISVQVDWRSSWTYGRAPNAMDISYSSLTCPSKHRHQVNLFIRLFREATLFSRLLWHAGDTEDTFSTLLLRTPGPVPFGTCMCSNVETILSWTFHDSELSNIPWYFYCALYHILYPRRGRKRTSILGAYNFDVTSKPIIKASEMTTFFKQWHQNSRYTLQCSYIIIIY